MPRTSVVTDTTSYLPAELREANQISLVSLYINWGGERTEREADITDIDAFMEKLRDGGQLPTTSQPSVGDFQAVYEPLLADGGEVVSVHISGGISGPVEAARQAAEGLERDGKGGERIHIYDSESSAGGLGLTALGAAKAAAAGKSGDEVLAAAKETRESLKMWFAIDTLEFLKRSGRIGGAAAWIGSTLRIKPSLTLEREMVPIERVRTTKRMLERLVAYAHQRKENGAEGWVIQHIQAEEQARDLIETMRAQVFGSDPVFTSEVGPVLAAHTGPGLLGFGSVPRDLVE
jgi:DegV family protein with EDD domain